MMLVSVLAMRTDNRVAITVTGKIKDFPAAGTSLEIIGLILAMWSAFYVCHETTSFPETDGVVRLSPGFYKKKKRVRIYSVFTRLGGHHRPVYNYRPACDERRVIQKGESRKRLDKSSGNTFSFSA